MCVTHVGIVIDVYKGLYCFYAFSKSYNLSLVNAFHVGGAKVVSQGFPTIIF